MFFSESSGASYHFFGSFCMILLIQPTEWPKWPVLKTEEPCFLKWGGTHASWQSQTNPLTSKQFVSRKLERNLARREKPWKTKLVDMKNKFHFSSFFFFPHCKLFSLFFPNQFDFSKQCCWAHTSTRQAALCWFSMCVLTCTVSSLLEPQCLWGWQFPLPLLLII